MSSRLNPSQHARHSVVPHVPHRNAVPRPLFLARQMEHVPLANPRTGPLQPGHVSAGTGASPARCRTRRPSALPSAGSWSTSRGCGGGGGPSGTASGPGLAASPRRQPRRQYPADVRRSFPGSVISGSACALPQPASSTLLHVRQQHARTRPRPPPAALKRVRSVIDALLPPTEERPWGLRRRSSCHEQHEADPTLLSWRRPRRRRHPAPPARQQAASAAPMFDRR